MPQNLRNIPTAHLVNAVLAEQFKWMNEGRGGPNNALLDAELLQDNYPTLLVDALEELNRRQQGMPISDCIVQEWKRKPVSETLTPILSKGKE
jgi:hypothetical protein